MNKQDTFEDGKPQRREMFWAPKRQKNRRYIPKKGIEASRRKLFVNEKLDHALPQNDSFDALGWRPLDLFAEEETVFS